MATYSPQGFATAGRPTADGSGTTTLREITQNNTQAPDGTDVRKRNKCLVRIHYKGIDVRSSECMVKYFEAYLLVARSTEERIYGRTHICKSNETQERNRIN
jgi:hypothetical protein